MTHLVTNHSMHTISMRPVDKQCRDDFRRCLSWQTVLAHTCGSLWVRLLWASRQWIQGCYWCCQMLEKENSSFQWHHHNHLQVTWTSLIENIHTFYVIREIYSLIIWYNLSREGYVCEFFTHGQKWWAISSFHTVNGHALYIFISLCVQVHHYEHAGKMGTSKQKIILLNELKQVHSEFDTLFLPALLTDTANGSC